MFSLAFHSPTWGPTIIKNVAKYAPINKSLEDLGLLGFVWVSFVANGVGHVNQLINNGEIENSLISLKLSDSTFYRSDHRFW